MARAFNALLWHGAILSIIFEFIAKMFWLGDDANSFIIIYRCQAPYAILSGM
jgi:hypothetical protein